MYDNFFYNLFLSLFLNNELHRMIGNFDRGRFSYPSSRRIIFSHSKLQVFSRTSRNAKPSCSLEKWEFERKMGNEIPPEDLFS